MAINSKVQSLLTLVSVFKRVSHELTGIVKEIASSLNLDPDVEVFVSYLNFTEAQLERSSEGPSVLGKVCGYYDSKRRLITLYYPCFIEGEELNLDRVFETIAHELIHHCQYTCRDQACRNVCSVHMTIDEEVNIKSMLPYELRPHEIEAFDKQERLAEEIRRRWRNTIEYTIHRLDVTLRLPINAVNAFLQQLEKSLNFSIYETITKTLISRYVGEDVLAYEVIEAVKRIKTFIDEELQGESHDTRSCIERKLSDVNELLRSYASSMHEVFVKSFLNANLKSVIFTATPVSSSGSRLKVYVVTNAGFAIAITPSAVAPLVTATLSPLQPFTISDISKYGKHYLNIDHYLRYKPAVKDFKVYLHRDEGEESVLQITAKHICNAGKNFGENLEELVVLILLLGTEKGIEVEHIELRGLDKELIRINTEAAKDVMKEFLICNNKIALNDKELHITDAIKAIISLNAENKEISEILKQYFVKRLIMRILSIPLLKKLDIDPFEDLKCECYTR